MCVSVLRVPKVLSNAQRLEQLNYQACLGTIKFLCPVPRLCPTMLFCQVCPLQSSNDYIFCDTLSQAIIAGKTSKGIWMSMIRLFSEDDLPPRLTMVNCTGDEANLQACPSVTGSQEIIRCDSAVVICQCTYLLCR